MYKDNLMLILIIFYNYKLFYRHFLGLIELDVIVLKDIKHNVFGKGRLAQLVEHLVYTEGVKGSSPLLPTKMNHEWGCSSVG